MAKVNPDFASEIIKYGATDFTACYNCGNCTAICSLTDKQANFPRIFIRQGILGQTEEILESKELWLCYACGDCSINCPRQAAPGDYMSAMRRYAISKYEPTGLTRLLFTDNKLAILITLFFATVLGFFLLTLKPENEVARWIFEYLPYNVIHNMGIAIFGLTGLSAAWGAMTMVKKLAKKNDKKPKNPKTFMQTLKEVSTELGNMKRYRDCDSEEDSFWSKRATYLRPWFVHFNIMWGFIGLLVATSLDFMFKDPATDIWWPSRIIGSIAGLMLMYGTTMALNYRYKKITRTYEQTKLADWTLLYFLWIAGLTGFWLEIVVFFNANNILNHIIFMIHTIISMELVLLFAFSKFAHAVYRPIALWFYVKQK